MRTVKVLDTTLRDGEQAPGFSMDLNEKLEMAHQIERLRVDVLEAGFAAASPGDFEAVRAIAREIRTLSVCSLARSVEKDIDAAYEAVREGEAPRIHIFLATSPIHRQYKLHMSKQQVLEQTTAAVAYAAKLCGDVQFSCEDATRTELAFLCDVIRAAIQNGAATINLPDTVGISTPFEMRELLRQVRERVPEVQNVSLSVHCHNDLGLACANTLAGVLGGASQIEGTVNGIGERAGNAALEEIVMTLHTRGALFEAETRIDTTQIYRTSRLLQSVTGVLMPPNKAIVGGNAFAHEAGIHQHGVMQNRETYEIFSPQTVGIPQNQMVLGKHSGHHAFKSRLVELGYALSEDELKAAFERFKELADKKKVIHDRDLEALIGAVEDEYPGLVTLEHFVINAGSTIDGTAIIRLKVGEETVQRVAMGDGPIDAAFQAINEILDRKFVLESYQLGAVTEGGDAMGESILRLSLDGKTVTGRGLSTDIIEATIKSYIHAVNKLLA